MPQMISFAARLRALAEAEPDVVAVTSGDQRLTRAELEAASDRSSSICRCRSDGAAVGVAAGASGPVSPESR